MKHAAKFGTRSTKSETDSKSKTPMNQTRCAWLVEWAVGFRALRLLSFGFVSGFGFRISDFRPPLWGAALLSCLLGLALGVQAQTGGSRLKIEIPKDLVRVADTPVEVQVVVQNASETAATAVALSAQCEGCDVAIEPKALPSLAAGGRATFALRLRPKTNAQLTSYGLFLDIASDGQPAERAGEMAVQLVTETGLGPEYAEVGNVTVRVSRLGEGPAILIFIVLIILIVVVLIWRKARQSAKTPPLPPAPPQGQ